MFILSSPSRLSRLCMEQDKNETVAKSTSSIFERIK
jgi:hypothetical protein